MYSLSLALCCVDRDVSAVGQRLAARVSQCQTQTKKPAHKFLRAGFLFDLVSRDRETRKAEGMGLEPTAPCGVRQFQ